MVQGHRATARFPIAGQGCLVRPAVLPAFRDPCTLVPRPSLRSLYFSPGQTPCSPAPRLVHSHHFLAAATGPGQTVGLTTTPSCNQTKLLGGSGTPLDLPPPISQPHLPASPSRTLPSSLIPSPAPTTWLQVFLQLSSLHPSCSARTSSPPGGPRTPWHCLHSWFSVSVGLGLSSRAQGMEEPETPAPGALSPAARPIQAWAGKGAPGAQEARPGPGRLTSAC